MKARDRVRVVCEDGGDLRAFVQLPGGLARRWGWVYLDLSMPRWIADQLSPYLMTKALRRLTRRAEERIALDAVSEVRTVVLRASRCGHDLFDASAETISRFVDEAWMYYSLTKIDHRVLGASARRLKASYGRAWYAELARLARGEDDGSDD